ncbi:MAG: hypothetical protein AB7H97_05315, partial [Pseudobdellovibrionaceae bacterium]
GWYVVPTSTRLSLPLVRSLYYGRAMTKFLKFLIFASVASPCFSSADTMITHRAISTRSNSVALPAHLEFQANQVQVIHSGWFNSLFDQDVCESAVSTQLDGRFDMKIKGPHLLDLSWNGRRFSLMTKAYATYIPTYYDFGAPVAPHVLVQLPNFVFLHMSINSGDGGKRQLTVSLVRGKTKLQPIFTATEF